MSETPKILYTLTDEAPWLATQSLLPVVQAYAATAGIAVDTRDISLAARLLSQFPEALREDQRVPDDLAELGELAKTPEANIIKLPNISASVQQLKTAIKELQAQGFPLPAYPDEPRDESDRERKPRYAPATRRPDNPVPHAANPDRRSRDAVKPTPRKQPHPTGQ